MKRNDELREQIRSLRTQRRLGARRIQNELRRLFSISLSLATIHKALVDVDAKPLVRIRRKVGYKIYNRPVPGDRIQMDTCKISPGLYQYTAVDDCTRCRVLALYPRRSGASTLLFLDKCIEEFPFPIQRIQTDRGREFFDSRVQARLRDFASNLDRTSHAPHISIHSVLLRNPRIGDRQSVMRHAIKHIC